MCHRKEWPYSNRLARAFPYLRINTILETELYYTPNAITSMHIWIDSHFYIAYEMLLHIYIIFDLLFLGLYNLC